MVGMSVKSKFDLLIQTGNKSPVPLAFYPGRKLIGASMEQILSDSDKGADCLAAIQKEFEPSMLVRMTELWVEAEAFGAQIVITENAFPAIRSKVAPDMDTAAEIEIPDMASGRLPVFIDMIKKARELMPDVLIFAGITGPFSLCGCLTEAEELMVGCYTDPDVVHSFIERITNFIVAYGNEYKKAGASGVFIAEPSICMLSPDMAEEFSHRYVKKIISEIQTDDFAVVYHNCGDVTQQLQNIKDLNAMAYHFGDAVSMKSVIDMFPKVIPVLGNIHPSKFSEGNESALTCAIKTLQDSFGSNGNFILSSGCDISPNASVKMLKTLCGQ